ncbi:hypothetical protein NP493_2405g00005, partial [Ridgeia piscesae]
HGCFFIISICIFYQSTIVLACKTLGHSLVTSRLDYGNAVLYGISDRLLHRLEMVQRSAARVVLRIRRGDWPFNNCTGCPQSIASSSYQRHQQHYQKNQFATHPTETVVCGDFNTKYGEPTCTDAVNLADLLDTAGFTQHVTGATHERGNTLDLVITAKTSHPIATAVKPTSLITDHYAVECELLQSKPSRLKRHITYRKQSAINNNIFAADLRSFNLNADEADPVVLLAAYDTCLRTIIDAHAPLVSRTITVRPTTPWHTNDLTEAKRALRRAERLWRNSSLTVHRQIFKGRRHIFRKLLKTARSDYYRSEISKAGGNMRLIYGITDSLLGRKVNMTLPEVADESPSALATRFQRYFKDKTEVLCQNRSDDTPTVVGAHFDVFEHASPSDVKKIVLASATKSCELDPLPTSIVKQHIDALSPLLARIINASLATTVFPAPMKHTVVVPI